MCFIIDVTIVHDSAFLTSFCITKLKIDDPSPVRSPPIDFCQQTSFEEPVNAQERTNDENMRSISCAPVSDNDAGTMERVMEPLYDLIDNWRRVISTGSNLPPSPIIIRNHFSAGEEDDDNDDDHSSTLANTIDLFPRYMRSMDVSASLTSSADDDDDDDDYDDGDDTSGSSSSSGPSYASPLSFVKSSSAVSRIFSGHEEPASASNSVEI